MRALLAIDIQNDFCPHGKLAVTNGDQIIRGINQLMADYDVVVLTQDWHPAGHSSFASSHAGQSPFSMVEMDYGQQVLWPDHCVQGSHGADFHADVRVDRANAIIRKGMDPKIDSYSAFFENDHKTPTGLHGYLNALGIDRVDLVGLATDYCVNYSAVDAAKLGYQTRVILDLCRAIDLEGSLTVALREMQLAGVDIV